MRTLTLQSTKTYYFAELEKGVLWPYYAEIIFLNFIW